MEAINEIPDQDAECLIFLFPAPPILLSDIFPGSH